MSETRDQGFLQKAANMATMSNFTRQHVGCVVVYKNKIIAAGFNSTKTHPKQKTYNRLRFEEDSSPDSLHAEIHALAMAEHTNVDFSKCTIYTSRRLKSGVPALARPCRSCMAYIKELGIKKVVYTTQDGYASEYIVEPAE